MDKILNILLLEDNESDALLNIRQLQKAGYSVHYERVETASTMQSALTNDSWDLVLADYQLPQFDAPNAFKVFKATGIDIPFIVISGVIGEEKAVDMMKAGVHDYFLKNNLTRLASAVERELREAEIRREQKLTHKNILAQHQLSLALSKTRSLKEALDLVTETVCHLDGVDCGGIYLENKKTGLFELNSDYNISPAIVEKARFFRQDSPVQERLLSGKSVFTHSSEINQLLPGIDEEGLHSMVMIPIQSEDLVIGCMNLGSHKSDTISKVTMMAIESIASQIGVTISRLQAEHALRESQRDLQQLFDTVEDFIFIFDLEGKILRANPYVGLKLGYTEEEILSMTAIDLHSNEKVQETIRILGEINEGKRSDCPLPLKTKDGRFIPVDTHVTLGKWGDKDVFIGISRDITERQRTEDALKTSEERFRRIFEDVPVGMATFDASFHFVRTNTAFCKFTGYSEPELKSLTFRDLTHPDHLKEDDQAISKLISGETSIYRSEKRYITKDRQVVWGSLVASILYDSKGKIIHLLAMVEDINERKNAEQEILKWKNHYEVVSLTSGQAVYIDDLQTGFIDWGGKTLQVLGYTNEEIGRVEKREALIHPEDINKTKNEFRLVTDCGSSYETKYRFLHKNGQYLYILDKGIVVCGEDGKPHIMIGMMQDITSLVLAEKELIKKEERYRKLFDLSPSGITLEDTDGTILDVNAAFCSSTGYIKSELIGSNVRLLVPDHPKRERHIKKDISVILSGKPHEHEVLNVRKDGSPLYLELHETLIPLPDGGDGILVVSNDITLRKQAEELMIESRRQLEIFAKSLQEAREEERILLARELHDNLGQNLTALKIDISRILKKLKDAPSNSHSAQIIVQGQDMILLIDSTIDLVRKISSDLRPHVLDELGINSAIEWQIHEFTKLSGIPCELDVDNKKVLIPPEFSVGVFRIFQETLTNIIRHANASRVIIRLKKKYSSVVLEVEDNGSGIHDSKINDHKSLGLIGMRERAMLFGGKVVIAGKKGKGTRVTLSIPAKKTEI